MPLRLLTPLLFLLGLSAFAQKETEKVPITGDAAKAILDKVKPDTTAFRREAAQLACQCIDSVHNAEKDRDKKAEGFADCIDREVTAYQLMIKISRSLVSDTKNNSITISTDKDAPEYKRYYYDLERWLKDSCPVLNRAISTNDEATEKSFSDNPEAMSAYNKGVEFLQKENYSDAIPWFEKAVEIDPEFAFAWDNLGISYRRTSQFAKAEAAYKASLKIDPTGKTPLQNLPVVYLLQKKVDEAIAAYKVILDYYPEDPEAYYGVGLAYLSGKKDMEAALDNLCKAYNLYVQQKSPFRSDAEKVINTIYGEMKKQNKEDRFYEILKENHIKSL